MDFGKTIYAKNNSNENEAKAILDKVLEALKEKGYNPTLQLSEYLLSGDPTYITGHKDARKIITKVDREEIIEVLVEKYMGSN